MYELALSPLIKATWETIYMVFISGFFSILLGMILGTGLFITQKNKDKNKLWLNRFLGLIVNVVRSFPFIILMITVIPLTRIIIGTTIGTNAAIVPLTIAAIPFFARITENALTEIPSGLIEAAHAMGATTWQVVTKVLVPESLSALIRGATLTLIGLIGYSAMAGVVGGGGLGELAVNYGYQRFDTVVMLETVIILIVMVQIIQMLGEYAAKTHRLKLVTMISLFLGLMCIGYQIWPWNSAQENTIRVGVMSGQPETVMHIAQKVAWEQYGVHLQIVTFSDYVQPNTALNNGSIDANIFQHAPYLEGQMKVNRYALIAIGKTFVYPMGVYSTKIKNISDLKEGAIVAIPNDPSNGGRALLILQKYALITLKKGVGTFATVNDIELNKLHLQFKLLDAAQLPRVLKDADLVAITNDFVGSAGLSIKQAVLKEGGDSPYANLIVVKKQDKNRLVFRKLVALMHSKPVLDITNQLFPNGAAIPAW